MQLKQEGTIGMTGGTVSLGSTITTAGALLYLAPHSSNAATIHVGIGAAPQLAVPVANEQGFTTPCDNPQALLAIGNNGDILRFQVWG